jgi:hypothetical protein
VGVGFQGGEIRLGGGEQFFDILAECRLIILGGQQVVAAGLQHDVASRLGLCVQGIQ